MSNEAFSNYCEILEKNYDTKEEEYNQHIALLKDSYYNLQQQLDTEYKATKEQYQDDLIKAKESITLALQQEQTELDKIKATRAAVIQAQIKEKEIQEQLSFYCVQLKEKELKDIAILESIKPKLENPRILSMLIWQTYFRTPMTNLCNNILGKSTKTGIYKITNCKTKECYIGQALDAGAR